MKSKETAGHHTISGCAIVNITYSHPPTSYCCRKCGAHVYTYEPGHGLYRYVYRCPNTDQSTECLNTSVNSLLWNTAAEMSAAVFFYDCFVVWISFFSFSKTGRHIHRIPLHIIRMYGIRTWNHSLNTCPAQPYRRYRHRISDRGHWRACGNSWCWRQYSRRPFPSSHFPIPLLPHSRLRHNHATRHRRRQSYPEDPLTGSVFLQGFRKLRFSFQELLHWFRCQRGFCMLFCFISLCFISLYFCSFYL